MELIIGFLLQVLILLYVFPRLDSRIQVSQNFKDVTTMIISFVLLNAIFRKLIFIFTLGLSGLLNVLTLGVAGLVLNALILLFLSRYFPNYLSLPGFFSAFLGGFLLTIANLISKFWE